MTCLKEYGDYGKALVAQLKKKVLGKIDMIPGLGDGAGWKRSINLLYLYLYPHGSAITYEVSLMPRILSMLMCSYLCGVISSFSLSPKSTDISLRSRK